MSFRASFVVAFVAVCSIFASAQSLPPSWDDSTYLGGTGNDVIAAQTIDASGNVYVAGISTSSDFPATAGVYEPTYPGPSGSYAIFVSKFSPGGQLQWSTFLGPGCFEFLAPSGIAVDASGNVYVSGTYECSGFPTTVNLGTSGSVFLAKLSSTGSSLVYSTTLGGDSVLGTSEVVLDSSANAFVIGAGDICCNGSTGIIGPLGGISDFWVAEVNSAGTALTWSVEIGGSDDDEAYGIAIDAANKLYLTGYAASQDFPTTSGALVQPGLARAFIMKLDPSKPPTSSIIYSALAGNPGNSANQFMDGSSIGVDSSGNAYVGAWTYNTGLYVSPHAFQTAPATTPNAYVFELNPAGSAITNGTYLGGGANDFIKALTVDKSGNVYASGATYSWDFPTTAYGNEVSYNNGLGFDVKLNPQFAAISSAEFGPNSTEAFTATSDGAGGLWVSGYTVAGLPTTPNAYQANFSGGADDAFLIHTSFLGLCSPTTVSICTLAEDASNSELIHFASQAANVEGAASISLALDGQAAYRVNAAQFDTSMPVAPGTHTATVTFRAVNAQTQTTQLSFTVRSSSTCPLNAIVPSLTICSPLNAAAVKGTVNITVQANESAPPKAVNLYVDSQFVAKLANQNATYTYSMTLAPGSHNMAVRGTDSNNSSLRANAVFRVLQ